MANPTTNYSFVLPTSSDLVTDLPADFDVALQGVDTRLKALQPGTTAGDLAYSSATANTNVRLPIGTVGQLLAVNSGATAPEWVAAPSSGSLTLLTSGSLSGASVTTASLSGAFTDLEIRIFNYKPATNGDGMSLRLNGDSTTNYAGIKPYSSWSSTSLINATSLGEIVPKTWNSGTQQGITVAKIYNYSKATVLKSANSLYALSLSDGAASPVEYKVGGQGMGLWNNTAAITTLTFFAASGNMTSGTYEIFGVK